MTNISNEWITLSQQRNGLDVQRKFAGLNVSVNEVNTVEYCQVFYWERESYPNGEVNKVFKKHYSLVDIPEVSHLDENENLIIDSPAKPILSGFISQFGQNAIVNPSRETISNLLKIELNEVDGYVLNSKL